MGTLPLPKGYKIRNQAISDYDVTNDSSIFKENVHLPMLGAWFREQHSTSNALQVQYKVEDNRNGKGLGSNPGFRCYNHCQALEEEIRSLSAKLKRHAKRIMVWNLVLVFLVAILCSTVFVYIKISSVPLSAPELPIPRQLQPQNPGTGIKNIMPREHDIFIYGDGSDWSDILSSEAEGVTGLCWNGTVNVRKLLGFVRNAKRLMSISITNTITMQKDNLEDNSLSIFTPFTLQNLERFTYRERVSSSANLRTILHNIVAEQLIMIEINIGKLQLSDELLLRDIIIKNRHSLHTIKISKLSKNSPMFNDLPVFDNVQDIIIEFDESEYTPTQSGYSIGKDFCKIFPNLRQLVVSEVDVPFSDVYTLFDCTYLSKIDIGIFVPRDIYHIDMSILQHAPPSLVDISFAFNFEIKYFGGSCKILGVEDTSKDLFVYSESNC